MWTITLGSHEIPHLVKAKEYDPTPSLFLTSSLPPSSEKVKLKATSMMARAQVWNVFIVCAQFKNNISRRVQSLQVAPLGLLLFQSRDIYPRKRGKWQGNRVHMLWKYAGKDWRKNNILPQVAALFLSFFFSFRLEPAISCALSSTFCGFLTAGWRGLKSGLKNGPWVMLFSREKQKIPIIVKINRFGVWWGFVLENQCWVF